VGDLLTLKLGTRKGLRRAVPATEWYERGLALESNDPTAASAAYERAVTSRPDFADAHNNLGRLLHDRARFAAAEAHYRLAICANESIALYWFNLGVVVEDQGRNAEAIGAYQRALAIDPSLADAHYNLARLYEVKARRAGDELMMFRAVRHLITYRSLAKASGNGH
jgi:tetratricopeptide (TPR) repeat protein